MVTFPLNSLNADNRFPEYITAQKNETGGLESTFFECFIFIGTVGAD
jgi:hypothetical protein